MKKLETCKYCNLHDAQITSYAVLKKDKMCVECYERLLKDIGDKIEKDKKDK